MRSPRRSWRRRLLFAGVLVLGLCLLVEALAFVAYWLLRGQSFSYARAHSAQAVRAKTMQAPTQTPNLAFQDSGGDTCIHPYLGFVANRDTDDQMMVPPRGYGVTAWGFVDAQGPVRKRDPRTVLVGIFGGSVAEFFGEDGADELATRLRAHRRFADRRIEFVRLGLGGFKQPQQLLTLTYLLSLGGELDVAINLDGFNEVTLGPLENVPRGVAAIFPRNWSLLAEHAPDPRERRLIGTVTVLQDTQRRLAHSFTRGPWRWSIAANFAWESVDRWLERAAGERLLRLQQNRRDDLPFHITGQGADDTASDDVLSADSVEVWARCSRSMHKICAAHGIAYFHFLQPNQYYADSKELSADELRLAFDPDSRYRPWVQRSYPRLRQAGEGLADAGINFGDLTQLFADVAGTIYVDNCCHVNLDGNRRLAHAIAAGIVGSGDGAEPVHALVLAELRVEAPTQPLTQPFARRELRLFGRPEGSPEIEVTYAPGASFASSDPSVAVVDRYGVVTALGAGVATITAQAGGREDAVDVRVAFPAIVDLGGAFAPHPLPQPQLHATLDRGKLALRVTAPDATLIGAVCVAVDPAPRAFCGGKVYVPLSSPQATPLAATSGEVRVEVTSPDPTRKTMYVQALYRVSGDVCGFALSNALAITP